MNLCARIMTGMGISLLAATPFCAAADRPAPAVSDDATTVLPAAVTPAAVPAGAFFRLKLNWDAPRPLKAGYTVFIHYKDAQGKTVFQGDHQPPVGTATPGWNGKVSYENRVVVPATLPEGAYRITLGLYDKKGRQPLKAGPGVSDLGGFAFDVGAFTVSKSAPWPQADTEKAPTLNLAGYKLVFNEEFDKPLDVSPWGPGTRWIAHTPWRGDFGDAQFTDPKDGFPFTVADGILRIEARKTNGKWRAGLLASNDAKGNGFSLQYGYFEMRAKMPPGPGVWPDRKSVV